MRENNKIKQFVKVLLPIVLLLGVAYAIPNLKPLKADDTNTQLVNATISDEKWKKEIFVTEPASLLEISKKDDSQLLQFVDSEDYLIKQVDETGQVIANKKITPEELNEYKDVVKKKTTETTSSSTSNSETNETPTEETDLHKNQILEVKEEKKVTFYLFVYDEESIMLSISSKNTDEENLKIPVTLKNDKNQQQCLFSFENKATKASEKAVVENSDKTSEKAADTDSSEVKKEATSASKEAADTSEEKTETSKVSEKQDDAEEEDKNSTEEEPAVEKPEKVDSSAVSSTMESLLKKKYKETDSFKPIELPIEETKAKKTQKSSPTVSITAAKLVKHDGTTGFDGNDNPGYDQNDSNHLVRSYDSVLYLASFSIESTDATKNYTDIKYRLDMELPDAYALDSKGKQRFNGEVVDNENGDLVDTDSTGKNKTSTGYVESTIKNNGQILIPMFVNVYGAENGKNILPDIKITIVSAKNKDTGNVEAINKVYDSTNLSALNITNTKVSAKPSVEAQLVKGNRGDFNSYISGDPDQINWEAVGIGINYTLKPISGRVIGDFRGSTYPNGKISINIESTSTYQETLGGTSKNIPIDLSGSNSWWTLGRTKPVHVLDYTVSKQDTTGWTKSKYASNTHNIDASYITTGVPNGKTEKIYTKEPTVSTEDKKKIGVYDTGDFSTTNYPTLFAAMVENYTPMYNPYTYLISGERTSLNEKSFASGMMVVEWAKDFLFYKGTGVYTTNLYITSINYDGVTEAQDSTVTLSQSLMPSGAAANAATFVKNENGAPFTGLSSSESWAYTNGDATVALGEENILVGGASVVNVSAAKEVQSIIRWNANSFEYDSSRDVFSEVDEKGWFDKTKTRYGVGKTKNYPSFSVSSKTDLENQYNWYSTPAAAKAQGKISAVKFVNKKPFEEFSTWVGAPIKVIGKAGAFDSQGNSNAAVFNTYWYDSNNALNGQIPADNFEFIPSVYDTSGRVTNYQNSINGDSIFIKPFTITTTTEPAKPIYKTNEQVEWTVTGNLSSQADTSYVVELETTLPKGMTYDPGSSKDSNGNTIAEPAVSSGPSGSTILKWTFRNVNPTKSDICEVKFTSTPILKDLTFDKTSIADYEISTVGNMSLESNTTIKDESKVTIRTSYGKVQLYQIQQIILTKEVDKKVIEVGTQDAANTSLTNDITYTISLENNSSDKLLDVNILDVLPYNTDSLGTNFDGSYTVKNFSFKQGTGTVKYNNSQTSENQDPNLVNSPSWGVYVPGTSNVTSIQNAKGFLVSADELEIGDILEFTITISPKNQKAGNLYRNRASFNSKLDLPVKSNVVETRVFGRDLTGYVWYDDDYDGLIGNKSDGSAEDPVANIPVKLYRTSQVNGSYVKQLVKESLTGETFIDGSGNSLIKTGTDGKYKFENLPEGEYLAEFMVGDIVVTKKVAIVTKQLVGSDPKLNSKADPGDFKTPEYNHPELNDLPSAVNAGEFIHHVTDVNAGLTRLSKIRLFKYEEGSVIDANGDGKLSDAEIEASTTNALEGAEFQLYKGNSTKDEDKIGNPVKTDSSGWLEFDGLPPGDYTIVETKAPEGFELLKDPIKVTVPTYNYIAIVHVPDKGQTKLPFTGGTKAMRIILIVSACLLVIGMAGVFLHFRPIKVRGGK